MNLRLKAVRARMAFFCVFVAAAQTLRAQVNVPIYTDQLVSGFQNWGWATLDFSNPSTVHSGTSSISVTITGPWQGIQIYRDDMDSSLFSSISFWINGGASGGQQLQVFGMLDITNQIAWQRPGYPLPTLGTNTWQQVMIPLSSLGVGNTNNFTGIVVQDAIGAAQPVFYLDDIELVALPPPALAHLTVNAGQSLRTADARWFGLNTAIWDSFLDTTQTLTLLQNIGCQALRFPGGSDADEYNWVTGKSLSYTWQWWSSCANFAHVATNLAAQAMITANYGTGSTNEAAAWVAWANGSTTNTRTLGSDTRGTNWNTVGYWASLRAATPLGTDDGRNFLRISRAAPLNFHSWEIGNEVYGVSWETDSNTVPHDPYTYALRARDYISLMKAVDPSIKIGVVVTPGEDSYANYTTHPTLNPRTGQTHNGWTPVLLSTLKSLGVTPDFAIHHRYTENPGWENDALLLQCSEGWATDAGNLRQQLTDYLGSAGASVELVCTENNTGGTGKQTTSLVNGLYLADSLAQLMKTEFNGLFWFDLRDVQVTNGVNNSSSLYGWRLYGDYGMVRDLTNAYPTYYVARLLQNFARPGDTVVSTVSDDKLLAAYAMRRLSGAVTLLVINKDPAITQPAQISISGFVPDSTATAYSYGIPQDTAAQTGVGSLDFAQTNLSGVGTAFTLAFPPYSATVLAFSPPRPGLLVLPNQSPPGQFIFQLQGQSGVRYVLQCSTNLAAWIPCATNVLSAATVNITNATSPGVQQQFWRALWQP